jgi:hypothetical protein
MSARAAILIMRMPGRRFKDGFGGRSLGHCMRPRLDKETLRGIEGRLLQVVERNIVLYSFMPLFIAATPCRPETWRSLASARHGTSTRTIPVHWSQVSSCGTTIARRNIDAWMRRDDRCTV